MSLLNADSFLRECQRFVVAVNRRDPAVVDVGLHGRQASWTLETETDPLGVKQPLLVGKYALVRHVDKQPSCEEKNKDDDDDDDDDDDPLAVSSSNTKQRRTLQVTLYVTFNQPYGVPALDFVACELESGGQPVYETRELQLWMPHLLDALELDSKQVALLDAGDENARLLSAAPTPRVSVAVHELLNRPAFNVHACDTVAHFKMMMMMMVPGGTNQVQSPIDAVLAFYGRFLEL